MPQVAETFPILTDPAARDDIVKPQGDFVKPKMGSIRERRRKDGSVGYTAQIILKRKGHDTYREAETFNRRGAAVAWIKNREAELKAPGGIERAKTRNATVGDAIDKMLGETHRKVGRTAAQCLRTTKTFDIAALPAEEATSDQIIKFARELSTNKKPQTVQNYLSHLSAVFRLAKPAWGIPLDYDQMKQALAVTKDLGLTKKSAKRTRRPTLYELDKLMAYFGEQMERYPDVLPMQKIIAYAIFSTRRQEEIVRPEWEHLDEKHSRLLVTDMKHPGQKEGNDVWVDLTPEALLIAQSMDRSARRIFPYSVDAITASFTRACYLTGINTPKMPDSERLHFHDLRHDGISRLFEIGWGTDGKGTSIPHVAAVSGHRSWASLQRYTHIRMSGDKYKDWKWLPVVTRGE